MHRECSPYTHTIQNRRDKQTCLPQKMCFKWQPSCTVSFQKQWVFFCDIERSKICGILWRTSKATKWPFTFWIKYTESKWRRVSALIFFFLKCQKVLYFLLNCAGKFIWFYPRTRLAEATSLFMKLALHTWQINSVIKPNIYVSWTQMEKKL